MRSGKLDRHQMVCNYESSHPRIAGTNFKPEWLLAMDQRFTLTTAHLRALRRMVFVHSPAENDAGLSACLLSDPLASFGGHSPGALLASWLGLKPPFDRATRLKVLDFYQSLPCALSLILQHSACPKAPQRLVAKGSLAMLLGYGHSAQSHSDNLPRLSPEATDIALALAQDPQTRFTSLVPLIDGIDHPQFRFLPSQQHLGLLQTLRFDWSWFESQDEGFADLFFAGTNNLTLVEYLERIPTIAAELPQTANQDPEQARLVSELEPALGYFLSRSRAQAGTYFRCRQTRGFWRREAHAHALQAQV